MNAVPSKGGVTSSAPLPSENQTAWWRSLGPGLISGAAHDDPSGMATYTMAGAQFGYATCWTALATYPLMVGIQLPCARIGRITGKGLTENFLHFCPKWVVYLLVFLLVMANIVNLGANVNAMAESVTGLIDGPKWLYAVAIGLVSSALQIFIPYHRYVNVLKWLTLSLLAYVGVAFAVDVDWMAALMGSLWPTITWSSDYVTTIVAILGTTICPYLFFWQAAQEVEEINRIPEDQPLKKAPGQRRFHLRRLRIDTAVGMAASNVVAFFMIVATAATLHQQGIMSVNSIAEAAAALKPIAGEFAFMLFAAGIIGTGMLALPVLAGSTAYALASVLGLRKGLDLPLHKAVGYYGILAMAMLLGVVISLMDFNPIHALYWAAVVNAVISVPIMVAVMLAASNPKIVGTMPLPTRWKALGWAATATMAGATLAMFATAVMHLNS